MSSSSLYKNNYKKLQSLKCLTASGKYDMLCKMARLSITGMKQFYKMLINNLSSPPVKRLQSICKPISHFVWPFPLTKTGSYVTNSLRPRSSCDTFSAIIRQIWINVSQMSPTLFERAFIENNCRISSDRESQRHCKVKKGALNYTHYKTSTFKNNHLV